MARSTSRVFEEFDDDLTRRTGSGVGRRRGLQPVVYKGGIPSAESARPSGITNAAILNLLAPQDFSGTGATGSADEAIRNSRRIKRDRQVAQLLTTLGGQQLQEEGATARATAGNVAKLKEADLARQTTLDTAENSADLALAKQKLLGEQDIRKQGLSDEAALERLEFKTSGAQEAQERGIEAASTASKTTDARQRRAANEERAFELFRSGDLAGAKSFATSGDFTPSFRGLKAPQAGSEFKFIPGQVSSVRGQDVKLPGKVFNIGTGEVQQDISDLSPEERDALLEILETRDTQGLR